MGLAHPECRAAPLPHLLNYSVSPSCFVPLLRGLEQGWKCGETRGEIKVLLRDDFLTLLSWFHSMEVPGRLQS